MEEVQKIIKKYINLKDRDWNDRQLLVTRLGKFQERKAHVKLKMFGSRGYLSGARQQTMVV
jgi:hypothetical protein